MEYIELECACPCGTGLEDIIVCLEKGHCEDCGELFEDDELVIPMDNGGIYVCKVCNQNRGVTIYNEVSEMYCPVDAEKMIIGKIDYDVCYECPNCQAHWLYDDGVYEEVYGHCDNCNQDLPLDTDTLEVVKEENS